MASPHYFQCSLCGFITDEAAKFLNHPCYKTTINAENINGILEGPTIGDEVPSDLQQGPPQLQKWEDRFVKLLIVTYKHQVPLLKKGKKTKKQIFEIIAKEFNTTADVSVTGEQCLRKWTKLEQKFKEVEDNNKRTGRAKKDWKFFSDMADCLGESPKINPAYTFDITCGGQSCSSTSSNTGNTSNGNGSNGDEDSDDEASAVKNLKPRRDRKRKSYSSSAEMLRFLETYTEKREKAEEEKVQLLREMHEEKKQFFAHFLDVLKNN